MVKLFIGGFPLDYSEMDIVKLLNSFGKVSTIKIVRDKISKKCKGYAFVEMTDMAGADRVIDELDGFTINERVLNINKVEEEPMKAVFKKPNIRTPSDYKKVKRPRRETQ